MTISSLKVELEVGFIYRWFIVRICILCVQGNIKKFPTLIAQPLKLDHQLDF
jgi:hypothetical protein